MQPRFTSYTLRFWIFVLSFHVSVQFVTATADMELRRFDVKEGEALTMLREAAQQADVDFIFAAKLLEGVRTRPVAGEYVPLVAFQEMLKGTGFVPFRHMSSGVFSIRKDIEFKTVKTELYPENPENMKELQRSIKELMKILLTSAAASGALSAYAQDEESFIELSPFVVTADTDGYAARNSLAFRGHFA